MARGALLEAAPRANAAPHGAMAQVHLEAALHQARVRGRGEAPSPESVAEQRRRREISVLYTTEAVCAPPDGSTAPSDGCDRDFGGNARSNDYAVTRFNSAHQLRQHLTFLLMYLARRRSAGYRVACSAAIICLTALALAQAAPAAAAPAEARRRALHSVTDTHVSGRRVSKLAAAGLDLNGATRHLNVSGARVAVDTVAPAVAAAPPRELLCAGGTHAWRERCRAEAVAQYAQPGCSAQYGDPGCAAWLPEDCGADGGSTDDVTGHCTERSPGPGLLAGVISSLAGAKVGEPDVVILGSAAVQPCNVDEGDGFPFPCDRGNTTAGALVKARLSSISGGERRHLQLVDSLTKAPSGDFLFRFDLDHVGVRGSQPLDSIYATEYPRLTDIAPVWPHAWPVISTGDGYVLTTSNAAPFARISKVRVADMTLVDEVTLSTPLLHVLSAPSEPSAVGSYHAAILRDVFKDDARVQPTGWTSAVEGGLVVAPTVTCGDLSIGWKLALQGNIALVHRQPRDCSYACLERQCSTYRCAEYACAVPAETLTCQAWRCRRRFCDVPRCEVWADPEEQQYCMKYAGSGRDSVGEDCAVVASGEGSCAEWFEACDQNLSWPSECCNDNGVCERVQRLPGSACDDACKAAEIAGVVDACGDDESTAMICGGESRRRCPSDCTCNFNGECDADIGETDDNCAADCAVKPVVCDLDGLCVPPESFLNCADCVCSQDMSCDSTGRYIGDNSSNPLTWRAAESHEACPLECPCNGDGACDEHETHRDCPQECHPGACIQDGTCGHDEPCDCADCSTTSGCVCEAADELSSKIFDDDALLQLKFGISFDSVVDSLDAFRESVVSNLSTALLPLPSRSDDVESVRRRIVVDSLSRGSVVVDLHIRAAASTREPPSLLLAETVARSSSRVVSKLSSLQPSSTRVALRSGRVLERDDSWARGTVDVHGPPVLDCDTTLWSIRHMVYSEWPGDAVDADASAALESDSHAEPINGTQHFDAIFEGTQLLSKSLHDLVPGDAAMVRCPNHCSTGGSADGGDDVRVFSESVSVCAAILAEIGPAVSDTATLALVNVTENGLGRAFTVHRPNPLELHADPAMPDDVKSCGEVVVEGDRVAPELQCSSLLRSYCRPCHALLHDLEFASPVCNALVGYIRGAAAHSDSDLGWAQLGQSGLSELTFPLPAPVCTSGCFATLVETLKGMCEAACNTTATEPFLGHCETIAPFFDMQCQVFDDDETCGAFLHGVAQAVSDNPSVDLNEVCAKGSCCCGSLSSLRSVLPDDVMALGTLAWADLAAMITNAAASDSESAVNSTSTSISLIPCASSIQWATAATMLDPTALPVASRTFWEERCEASTDAEPGCVSTTCPDWTAHDFLLIHDVAAHDELPATIMVSAGDWRVVQGYTDNVVGSFALASVSCCALESHEETGNAFVDFVLQSVAPGEAHESVVRAEFDALQGRLWMPAIGQCRDDDGRRPFRVASSDAQERRLSDGHDVAREALPYAHGHEQRMSVLSRVEGCHSTSLLPQLVLSPCPFSVSDDNSPCFEPSCRSNWCSDDCDQAVTAYCATNDALDEPLCDPEYYAPQFGVPPHLAYCSAAEHCFDGVLNGDETSVDCGGAVCRHCGVSGVRRLISSPVAMERARYANAMFLEAGHTLREAALLRDSADGSLGRRRLSEVAQNFSVATELEVDDAVLNISPHLGATARVGDAVSLVCHFTRQAPLLATHIASETFYWTRKGNSTVVETGPSLLINIESSSDFGEYSCHRLLVDRQRWVPGYQGPWDLNIFTSVRVEESCAGECYDVCEQYATRACAHYQCVPESTDAECGEAVFAMTDDGISTEPANPEAVECRRYESSQDMCLIFACAPGEVCLYSGDWRRIPEFQQTWDGAPTKPPPNDHWFHSATQCNEWAAKPYQCLGSLDCDITEKIRAVAAANVSAIIVAELTNDPHKLPPLSHDEVPGWIWDRVPVVVVDAEVGSLLKEVTQGTTVGGAFEVRVRLDATHAAALSTTPPLVISDFPHALTDLALDLIGLTSVAAEWNGDHADVTAQLVPAKFVDDDPCTQAELLFPGGATDYYTDRLALVDLAPMVDNRRMNLRCVASALDALREHGSVGTVAIHPESELYRLSCPSGGCWLKETEECESPQCTAFECAETFCAGEGCRDDGTCAEDDADMSTQTLVYHSTSEAEEFPTAAFGCLTGNDHVCLEWACREHYCHGIGCDAGGLGCHSAPANPGANCSSLADTHIVPSTDENCFEDAFEQEIGYSCVEFGCAEFRCAQPACASGQQCERWKCKTPKCDEFACRVVDESCGLTSGQCVERWNLTLVDATSTSLSEACLTFSTSECSESYSEADGLQFCEQWREPEECDTRLDSAAGCEVSPFLTTINRTLEAVGDDGLLRVGGWDSAMPCPTCARFDDETPRDGDAGLRRTSWKSSCARWSHNRCRVFNATACARPSGRCKQRFSQVDVDVGLPLSDACLRVSRSCQPGRSDTSASACLQPSPTGRCKLWDRSSCVAYSSECTGGSTQPALVPSFDLPPAVAVGGSQGEALLDAVFQEGYGANGYLELTIRAFSAPEEALQAEVLRQAAKEKRLSGVSPIVRDDRHSLLRTPTIPDAYGGSFEAACSAGNGTAYFGFGYAGAGDWISGNLFAAAPATPAGTILRVSVDDLQPIGMARLRLGEVPCSAVCVDDVAVFGIRRPSLLDTSTLVAVRPAELGGIEVVSRVHAAHSLCTACLASSSWALFAGVEARASHRPMFSKVVVAGLADPEIAFSVDLSPVADGLHGDSVFRTQCDVVDGGMVVLFQPHIQFGAVGVAASFLFLHEALFSLASVSASELRRAATVVSGEHTDLGPADTIASVLNGTAVVGLSGSSAGRNPCSAGSSPTNCTDAHVASYRIDSATQGTLLATFSVREVRPSAIPRGGGTLLIRTSPVSCDLVTQSGGAPRISIIDVASKLLVHADLAAETTCLECLCDESGAAFVVAVPPTAASFVASVGLGGEFLPWQPAWSDAVQLSEFTVDVFDAPEVFAVVPVAVSSSANFDLRIIGRGFSDALRVGVGVLCRVQQSVVHGRLLGSEVACAFERIGRSGLSDVSVSFNGGFDWSVLPDSLTISGEAAKVAGNHGEAHYPVVATATGLVDIGAVSVTVLDESGAKAVAEPCGSIGRTLVLCELDAAGHCRQEPESSGDRCVLFTPMGAVSSVRYCYSTLEVSYSSSLHTTAEEGEGTFDRVALRPPKVGSVSLAVVSPAMSVTTDAGSVCHRAALQHLDVSVEVRPGPPAGLAFSSPVVERVSAFSPRPLGMSAGVPWLQLRADTRVSIGHGGVVTVTEVDAAGNEVAAPQPCDLTLRLKGGYGPLTFSSGATVAHARLEGGETLHTVMERGAAVFRNVSVVRPPAGPISLEASCTGSSLRRAEMNVFVLPGEPRALQIRGVSPGNAFPAADRLQLPPTSVLVLDGAGNFLGQPWPMCEFRTSEGADVCDGGYDPRDPHSSRLWRAAVGEMDALPVAQLSLTASVEACLTSNEAGGSLGATLDNGGTRALVNGASPFDGLALLAPSVGRHILCARQPPDCASCVDESRMTVLSPDALEIDVVSGGVHALRATPSSISATADERVDLSAIAISVIDSGGNEIDEPTVARLINVTAHVQPSEYFRQQRETVESVPAFARLGVHSKSDRRFDISSITEEPAGTPEIVCRTMGVAHSQALCINHEMRSRASMDISMLRPALGSMTISFTSAGLVEANVSLSIEPGPPHAVVVKAPAVTHHLDEAQGTTWLLGPIALLVDVVGNQIFDTATDTVMTPHVRSVAGSHVLDEPWASSSVKSTLSTGGWAVWDGLVFRGVRGASYDLIIDACDTTNSCVQSPPVRIVLPACDPVSQVADDQGTLCLCSKGFERVGLRCQRCPENKFSDKQGLDPCEACPPNTHTMQLDTRTRSVDCVCADGMYEGVDPSTCVPCPVGSVNFDSGAVLIDDRHPATDCRAAVNLRNASSPLVVRRPIRSAVDIVVQPGWWRESPSSTVMYKCAIPPLEARDQPADLRHTDECADLPHFANAENPERAVEFPDAYWLNGTAIAAWPYETADASDAALFEVPISPRCAQCPGGRGVSGDSACGAAYAGKLCSSCAAGFGKRGARYCTTCPEDRQTAWIVVAAQLGASIAVVLGLTRNTVKAANHLQERVAAAVHSQKKSKQPSALKDMTRMSPALKLSLVMKIAISYAQTAMLAQTLELRWPTPMLSMFSWLETLSTPNLNTPATDCLLTKNDGTVSNSLYLTKWLIVVLMPFALALLYILWCAVAFQIRQCRASRAHGNYPAWRPYQNAIVVVVTVVGLVFHPIVTKRVLSMLSCRTLGVDPVEGALQFLRDDLNIQCWTERHSQYVVLALVMLATVCVGFPLWAVVVVCRNRKPIRYRWRLERSKLFDPELHKRKVSVLERYAFIFFGFEDEVAVAQFWEVGPIVLRKSSLLLCFTIFAELDVQLRTLSALVVLMLALIVHIKFQPYDDDDLDNVESLSLLATFATFFVGLFFGSSNTVGISARWAEAVTFVVLGLNVLVGVAVFVVVLKVWHQQASETLAAASARRAASAMEFERRKKAYRVESTREMAQSRSFAEAKEDPLGVRGNEGITAPGGFDGSAGGVPGRLDAPPRRLPPLTVKKKKKKKKSRKVEPGE